MKGGRSDKGTRKILKKNYKVLSEIKKTHIKDKECVENEEADED